MGCIVGQTEGRKVGRRVGVPTIFVGERDGIFEGDNEGSDEGSGVGLYTTYVGD